MADESDSDPTSRFADMSVHELLDAVSARTTAPGGGVAAALCTAMAAALTAMAARFDHESARTTELVQMADEVRERATVLADADVAVYARYVAARRAPAADREQALDAAVDVPMQVTGLAERIAVAASVLAHEGNPRLRGDAATACWVAAAAARSASGLVVENLMDQPDDERVRQARRWAGRAHDCAMGLS